ncbi:helix-turn-helix transcriptional regulator [Listeria valentina]|uniref:helix-turn-helix transcriptional regulator n=1 Tax=Listeria valentina TaxID=2705293 RepID=UPI001430D801|nr:HTH domain-containing protein [Listeria valentina]
MQKVERINTIMRYINNRAHFTIAEIMNEFQISRSTVIRDLREIEQIGLPLIAEVGRSGGYSVMNNAILPPIRFTDNEIKALVVAFMATRNQQLPFLRSRQSLAEKLLGLISANQQDDLVVLNQLLFFEGTNPNNPDLLDLSDLPQPMLEQLIEFSLYEEHLEIYINGTKYLICPLRLYNEKSIWWLEYYDFQQKVKKLDAVDEIESIQAVQSAKNKRLPSKKQILKQLAKEAKEENLHLELGAKAISQFKKYHPLKFSLAYTNPYQTSAILKTQIDTKNEAELCELVHWLLFLGEELMIRKMPPSLQNAYQERVRQIASF